MGVPGSTEDRAAPANTAPLVLMAEDDPAIRTLLSKKLERAGLRVVSARDGTSALALALAEPPAVIVSDWNMAPMDGLTFASRVMAEPSIGNPPVLMLTARQFDVTPEMLEGTNIKQVLRKPFSSKRLIEAVLATIEQSGAAESGAIGREAA
jgi:CheY-like chemotaxis protein